MRDCSNYRDYKGDNLETIPGIGIYTTNLLGTKHSVLTPVLIYF
jgi:hypothetical protein